MFVAESAALSSWVGSPDRDMGTLPPAVGTLQGVGRKRGLSIEQGDEATSPRLGAGSDRATGRPYLSECSRYGTALKFNISLAAHSTHRGSTLSVADRISANRGRSRRCIPNSSGRTWPSRERRPRRRRHSSPAGAAPRRERRRHVEPVPARVLQARVLQARAPSLASGMLEYTTPSG